MKIRSKDIKWWNGKKFSNSNKALCRAVAEKQKYAEWSAKAIEGNYPEAINLPKPSFLQKIPNRILMIVSCLLNAQWTHGRNCRKSKNTMYLAIVVESFFNVWKRIIFVRIFFSLSYMLVFKAFIYIKSTNPF